MSNTPAVNCRKCMYYFVTWDPVAPCGCRFHGFKSKELPSVIVYKSSGMACQAYTQKSSPK